MLPPVVGFPNRRVLPRLRPHSERSLPLPISQPQGLAALREFPGSDLVLYPTAVGALPEREGWRTPVPATGTLLVEG